MTGLPAQRATGFEPGPSNRDPGPIKPNPFRNPPTRPPPISHTQLIDKDPNDWWAAQKLPVLSPNSPIVPQKSARVNGISTDSGTYPQLPSFAMPGAWSPPPPSYVEFEPDNAMEDNNTTHIKEGEHARKGPFKHFLKTRRRSQKTQSGSDATLAHRLQDEEDQMLFNMDVTNPFEDRIDNTAGGISTIADRFLPQHLQGMEEQVPRGSLTQASCPSATSGRDLRKPSVADDTARSTALLEEGGRPGVRSKATEQLHDIWEGEHQSTMSQQAPRGKWAKAKNMRFDQFETKPNDNAAVPATSPKKNERMAADFKAALALQAQLKEEARQEEIKTLKELQAKFEDEESQDARLAAELAAQWEKEDRQEMERSREQDSTCTMCIERCEKAELFKPCSDKKHIWCRKCLHGKNPPPPRPLPLAIKPDP